MTEREIFLEALEQPSPEARQAFLQWACGRDPALHRSVSELLNEHFSPDPLLAGPALQDASTTASFEPVDELPAQMVGRYKLLEKIGEGGFGEVWMAEQREPVRRRVALKIIKLGMDSRQVVARFEAERQALAMMDHPNIARILDAGTVAYSEAETTIFKADGFTGRPYFVMELVRGVRITEYCDQNQLGTVDRLKLVIQVCQAIQHAHQKGIIHRDIKPSNILVSIHDGQPVPKVIDFGIAKATQQELTDKTIFTQFQQFIGTPAYISPEQAEMSGLDIDTRADIYSLGVLIYELLVGQTPFDAREMMQGGLDGLRKLIREREPLRPSTRFGALPLETKTALGRRRQAEPARLIHQLEGDLDWIVMKCLEKDRTRRYDTANGLAMDIQRHLSNEPVVARPPSPLYKFQKAWQRNQLVFTAGAAVALALFVGTGVSTWQAIVARRATRAEQEQRLAAQAARAAETTQRRLVEAQERIGRRLSYASDISLVPVELERGNLVRARELLDRHRPPPGKQDLRGWEWRYLWRLSRDDPHQVLFKLEPAHASVTFSTDGTLILASREGRITLRKTADGSEVQSWGGSHPVFHPTGSILAYVPNDETNGLVRFRDLRTNQNVGEIRMEGAEVARLEFSSDGSRLLVWTVPRDPQNPGEVRLFGVQDGRLLDSLSPLVPGSAQRLSSRASAWSADGRNFYCSADSPEGSRLAGWDFENGNRIWDTASPPGCGQVQLIRPSPDGKRLVVGFATSTADLLLIDASSGRILRRLAGHRAEVRDLVWLDSDRFVSGGADRSLRVWDVRESIENPLIRVLHGHDAEILRLAVEKGRNSILSVTRDNRVFRWDLSQASRRVLSHLVFSSRFEWNLAGAGGSQTIIGVEPDGRVIRRTGEMFESRTVLAELGPGFVAAKVIDHGRRVVAGYRTGEVRLLNVDAPDRVQTFQAVQGPAIPGDWLASSNWLAVASAAGLWNTAILNLHSGAVVRNLEGRAARFAKDGNFLSWMDRAGGVVQLDLTSGILLRPSLPWRVEQLTGVTAVSPDGRYLATLNAGLESAEDGMLSVWSFQQRTNHGFYGRLMKPASVVTFSPDGQRVVSGSSGQEAVKFWDFTSCQELLTLGIEDGPLASLEFLDANTMVGSTPAGVQHVWRVPDWNVIEAEERKATNRVGLIRSILR